MLNLFRSKKTTKEISPVYQDGDGVHVTFQELIAQRRFISSFSFDMGGMSKNEGAGPNKSPFKGRGMEFDEVRSYVPGDDVRLIDWRVTARTGKTHTKLYREERERSVLFLGDFLPNMHFGTKKAFKSVVGARLLAALAWASHEHGDKIGAVILSAQHYFKIAPHRQMRRLMQIFNAVVDASNDKSGKTLSSFTSAVAELARVSKNGGRVYIISDFNELNDDIEKHLTYIGMHCDVVCIQIFDTLEQTPPPAGMYRITDGKETVSIRTDNPSWRQKYEKIFEDKRDRLKSFCKKRRFIYVALRTDQDMPDIVRRAVLKGGN